MSLKTARSASVSASTMVALMVAVLTVSVGYGVVLPLLRELIERLLGAGVGAAQVARHTGLLTAAYTLSLFLFAPQWGRLTDRLGSRGVLLVGLLGSERFWRLVDMKTHAQRALWASTSTKNPDYDHIKYVEALIGAETVTTVPMETLNAYHDHGDPKVRIEDDVEPARLSLARLSQQGVSIDSVTQQLVDEGIETFTTPFDRLLAIIEATGRPCREAVIS